MFEKPRQFSGRNAETRILASKDSAARLVDDLSAADIDGSISPVEYAFSNRGNDNEEKMAVIDITRGTKDAVKNFLRNRIE